MSYMCVICQLSMEAIVALGLSYQPTPQDLDAMLVVSQRMEQLVVNYPDRVQALDRSIQKIVALSMKRHNDQFTYMAFTFQELLAYHQELRK